MNLFLNHIKHESLYESYAPCISSENLTAILIKFTHTIRASFTKLRLIFHTFSLIINTLVPRLRETMYAARVKLFADCRGFSRTLLRLVVVCKTAFAKRLLQGAKKMEIGGC
jgi:hypothetical protein